MNEQSTPNLAQKTVATLKKHERNILRVTTVLSVGTAVLMRTGIKQHNDFLREHGLYEQFYSLTPTES